MLSRNHFLHQRYRIIRALGKGGFGQVYEALDDKLDCIVAIKEQLAKLDSEKMRRAFEKEAKLLANLRHPVLPKVMDHFFAGNGQYLVMEFIEGDDLARLLSKWQQPFTVEQVLTWADELLKALTYLHTRPEIILHRDIKPGNIKLTNEGEIFLLDFGLAKGYAGEMYMPETSQQSSSVHGFTPAYAPLEQLTKSGTNEQSDIYALGATLYHLLTGRLPVNAAERYKSMEMNGRDPLLTAHAVCTTIPPPISLVLSQAMAMSRRERLRSAAEMQQAFIAARREVAEAGTESYSPSSVQISQRPGNSPSNAPLPTISSPIAPSPGAPSPVFDPPPSQEVQPGNEVSWPSQFTSESEDSPWVSTVVDSELHDESESAPPDKETTQEAVEAFERKKWEEELERQRLAEVERKDAEEKRLREEAEERQCALAEQERVKAEEARRQREAEAVRRAEEERHRQEQAERERLKAEEAARRLEQERESERLRAEQGAWQRAEEERQRAETEAQRIDEEAARQRAAEETRLHATREQADELSTIMAAPEIYRPLPARQPSPTPRFNYKLIIAVSVIPIIMLGAAILMFFHFKNSGASQAVKNSGVSQPARANQANNNNQTSSDVSAHQGFRLKQSIGNQGGIVWSVAFSPDGKLAASAGDSKIVSLWDTETWQKSELKGHSDIINSVAFSADGQFIASGSKDKNILVWNIADHSPPRTFSGHSNQVLFIAFSHDGQILASASADRKIKLWNVETGKIINTLKGHTDEVWSIAFSSDGKTLVSAGRDDRIIIWDVATGTPTKKIPAVKVYSLALSSDGETLASGHGDNSIKLWNLKTGQVVKTLTGHTKYVSYLAFTQNGATLASASDDGNIMLWDVQSGKNKQILQDKDKKSVKTLSFSPDGKTLLSGGENRNLNIWREPQ